ncbi:MAG: hypothetical protein JWR69_3122 [Pedosphaera sp.]|nr:hypothetical protein [Pedosphaera sp.]
MNTQWHSGAGWRLLAKRWKLKRGCGLLLLAGFAMVADSARAQYPAGPQITKDGTAVALQDSASLPLSSRTLTTYPPAIDYSSQLGRVNFLRSEPTNAPLWASRFFVNDLNRNLYLLDRSNKTFTIYINFEQVFPKFDNNPGFAGGLVTFAFDPEYATNHKFYTVHTEDPAKSGSAVPTNGSLPGFNVAGYTTATVLNPPAGTATREAVLVEWTDTNITNAMFEGTAREILRVGFNNIIHPMGDLIFNPLAQPGDADYRNLYISNGDGGAGETSGTQHPTPQRLDALEGKILRITTDTKLHPADALSANGRYRVPTTGTDPNPFVSLSLTNLKKEIYAYGFRNPHRMSWDPVSNKLIADDIGLYSWEEVNIISKGSNYGYAEREGIEQLFVGGTHDGKTGSQTSPVTPFPSPDSLTVTGIVAAVTPVYPAAEYSHKDGDAISSGFVYRGSLMPALRGKYLFGDISTGRLLYCDLGELLAADDGNRTTVAVIHELQVVFNNVERRMFDIVADEYKHKGGNSSGQALPTGAPVTSGNDPYGVAYGGGRADIRLALGGDGEIYVLSKSDGMVRKLVGTLSPPTIQAATFTNGLATLTWSSITNHHYRLQFKSSLTGTNWTDVAGDVTAAGPSASKSDTPAGAARFYRVLVLP